MPVAFPSTTDDIDPRTTARTSVSASGVTIRGVDTLNGNADAALYVTQEIVRTQYDIAGALDPTDPTDRFNFLEYTGSESFNTSGVFLTNWEKADYQDITFQDVHTNQFVFEFDANDGDWVLAAYDEGGVLIEQLDIGVPAISDVSAGQFYGISASNIKYATLTDTFVLSAEAGGSGSACNPAVAANCGEWVLVDNITFAKRASVPVPAALPLMRAAGWGRVINIASAHGLTASPYKSAYVAAKHGIVGLTKVTGLETAREAITANAICPGYVLTPLVESQIPDTMEKYGMGRDEVIEKVLLERQPSKEFATTDQLGDTAVFLCSDAAAQITGTTISVDGGWTAL